MKRLFKLLTILYIIFPLIVIPIIALKAANWFYLLGIVFYYISIYLVAIKQKIIFLIPVFFYIWFWNTFGFGIMTYAFFSLMCLLTGAIFYLLVGQVDKFITKTIPDNKEALEYELKMQEVENKLEQFRHANPSTKITQEIMERIRNQVFFK